MAELNLDGLEQMARSYGAEALRMSGTQVVALIAKVRELERRATDGQRAGVPEPFASICREELARRKLTSHPLKFAFAKERGMADIGEVHDWMRRTARAFEEAVQALAAAPTPDIGMTISPTPPAGAGRDRMDAALRTIAEWPVTPAGNMDAENMRQVARAAIEASKGEKG